MGYAIICNARKGENLGVSALALVDRAKSKSLWWTSDEPYLILNYKSKDAAQFACKLLRKNSPRVVNYSDACRLIREQNNEIIKNVALSDMEQGWDGHKSAF